MKQRTLLRTGVRGVTNVSSPPPPRSAQTPTHDLDGQFLPNVSYTYTPISFQRALREEPPPQVPCSTTNQWDSLRPTQLCSKMFSLSKKEKKKKRDRKAKRYLADVRTTPKERAKSINCHALFEVVLQCPTHPCKGKGMRGGFSFILLIVYILTSQIVYELLLSIIALCMRWHAPYVNCFDCSLYLTVIFRCARCAVCAVCSIC